MKRLCCLACACATLISATALASESDTRSFDITLHRPFVVGQKMHVKGDGVLEREMKAFIRDAAQTPQRSELKISFDAEATVEAIDAKGRPSRVVYAVRECVARQDGIASVLATPGSTITAERSVTGTIFTIDGRPAGPVANEALQLVAALDAGGATEDEVAGTTVPRTIGDSWPVDPDVTSREIQRQSGQAVRRNDIAGSTTLVDVTDHGGETCLSLYTQMTTTNAVPGLGNLPAGFSLREGSMTASSHRMYPVDARLPALSDFRRTQVTATLTGQPGPSQPYSRMQFKMVQMVELETIPIAPHAARALQRASQATDD